MSVIEIEHLTKDYGGGKGVFDLTFSVAEGETFGFLGPNGAGKTTTIRQLMGFIAPQSGRCAIRGLTAGGTRRRYSGNWAIFPGKSPL